MSIILFITLNALACYFLFSKRTISLQRQANIHPIARPFCHTVKYMATSTLQYKLLAVLFINLILLITFEMLNDKATNIAYSVVAAFIFDLLVNQKKELTKRKLFSTKWKSHIDAMQRHTMYIDGLLTKTSPVGTHLHFHPHVIPIQNLTKWYFECVFEHKRNYVFERNETAFLDFNKDEISQVQYNKGMHFRDLIIKTFEHDRDVIRSILKSADYIESFPFLEKELYNLNQAIYSLSITMLGDNSINIQTQAQSTIGRYITTRREFLRRTNQTLLDIYSYI